MNGRVTLLVNSCDSYSDVWPLFFSALSDYWPSRKMLAVLNTETKSIPEWVANARTQNVKSRDGDRWGLRLLESLKSVESEYVVVVYDDFIMEEVFRDEDIDNLIRFMDGDEGVAVCYLSYIGLNTLPAINEHGQSMLFSDIDYRLNSAPALWRVKDLINYTGPDDTPWAWEVFGSYRTFGDGKKFYAPSSPANDVYKYNREKGGAIYRGKWVADVVEPKNEKYKLDMDLSVRGVSVDGEFEKRSLVWKLRFMLLGFRMIGFKSLRFAVRAVLSKMNKIT